MSHLVIASHKTPIGVLQVVADVSANEPAVLSSGWLDAAATIARITLDTAQQVESTKSIDGITNVIGEYFDGNLGAFQTIHTRQDGGPFMQDAWLALNAVPSGTVVSYAQLASAAGRPKAVRAAASACARNLVAPFIPCHRVIRTDGSLGGYYYGLDKKIWLLNHEGHTEFSV